jgi:hypothetical protein
MNQAWRSMAFCVLVLAHSPAWTQQSRLPGPNKQANKPLLFASLPSTFEVSATELQKIFSAGLNDDLLLNLSDHLLIQGKIVDKYQHNPGSVSINIRVSNYANALFNITLKLQADNSAAMQGRILHPKYGDVLQLYKRGESYFIKKTSQALFMPE